MYGYDQFLIASTIATLFWLFATLYLQRNFLIYTLFVGKKRAYTVHIVIMVCVVLQQIALTVWDIKSRWIFSAALWPLGAVVFALSVALFVMAVSEAGPGVLIGAEVFGRKKPSKGPVWKRYKQPVALAVGGMYVGLALLTGHNVYFIVAALMTAGFALVSLAISRLVLS